MDALQAVVRETLVVTAALSLPVLAAATVVGTLVAVVQAATQVQEQTLTLLPKMLTVGLLVAAFGTFGMHVCAQLFDDVLAALPAIAHG